MSTKVPVIRSSSATYPSTYTQSSSTAVRSKDLTESFTVASQPQPFVFTKRSQETSKAVAQVLQNTTRASESFSKEIGERVAEYAQENIFGAVEWEECFGIQVGPEPERTEAYYRMMESQDPMSQGKKMSETHLFAVLRPHYFIVPKGKSGEGEKRALSWQEVRRYIHRPVKGYSGAKCFVANDQDLGPMSLQKRRNMEQVWRLEPDRFATETQTGKECEKMTSTSSAWLLARKEIFARNYGGKQAEEAIVAINSHFAPSAPFSYETRPTFFDFTTVAFAHFATTGTRWLGDAQGLERQATFTYCSNGKDNQRPSTPSTSTMNFAITLGGFSRKEGLKIQETQLFAASYKGIGGIMKVSQEESTTEELTTPSTPLSDRLTPSPLPSPFHSPIYTNFSPSPLVVSPRPRGLSTKGPGTPSSAEDEFNFNPKNRQNQKYASWAGAPSTLDSPIRKDFSTSPSGASGSPSFWEKFKPRGRRGEPTSTPVEGGISLRRGSSGGWSEAFSSGTASESTSSRSASMMGAMNSTPYYPLPEDSQSRLEIETRGEQASSPSTAELGTTPRTNNKDDCVIS